MRIAIINKQRDLKINPTLIRRVVRAVVKNEKRAYDEVALHFISPKAISELHEKHFDDPSLTDCISFPLDDEIMGDVFICPRVAITYAHVHGIEPIKELTLYIVHGLLHLMGYDDIKVADRKKMRRAEKRHLKNIANLQIPQM